MMQRAAGRRRSRLLVVGLVMTLLASVLAVPSGAGAQAGGELFFSEYIEGSSNNKALEIFNPTGAAVDLAAGGYNVQMYFNGSPTAGLTINLSGTVASGDVFVLAHSSAVDAIKSAADQLNGSGWFNGDDAVVLRKGSTVIDAIGQVGFDPGSQWGSGDASTADNTLRRKSGVTGGDTNPSDAFAPADEWDGLPQDTFGGLGSHQAGPPPDNFPIAAVCPAPVSLYQGSSLQVTATATDPDGRVVAAELVGPVPTGISLGDVVPASEVGGTASADLNIGAETPVGTYSIPVRFTNEDAEPQSSSCTVSVSVQGVISIGQVQGPVGPNADGHALESPMKGDDVVVRGVITQLTISGGSLHGFFLQNTAATADDDPTTSDGIFVFLNRFDDLLREGGGPNYLPQVGDEIILKGEVSEYFKLTQLDSPLRLLQVVRTGVDLDAEVPAFLATPPDDWAEAGRFWESRESMRAQIPAGSIAISGRKDFSGGDSEIWLAGPDTTIAQRTEALERRSFRDFHPLDDDPAMVDNGNGYRVLIGTLGVKATSGDVSTLLSPARTFDTVTNALTGGVYYSFNKYQVMVGEQPMLAEGADPSLNAPPQAADRNAAFTVATYNVENLYDFRDDPFDGCDFPGNGGCTGVRPPFDYVPESQAAYEDRLPGMAAQIIQDMHAPDLILIQEAEDQDICVVEDGSLICGTTDDADGKPDTLQELALAIAAAGGPAYDAAYDRDGADDRGITSAFLYRTDRVQLLAAAADHPVLGSEPSVSYRSAGLAYNTDVQNPKVLNADLPADVDDSTGTDGSDVFTRAPQVGLFRVWRNGVGDGAYTDIYAISNHFSSGPDRRVGQRREQAAYNAAIVAALQAADAQARVVVGGDMNVFPRPDDPYPGAPTDQLGPLYEAGLSNLYDSLLAEVPVSAYSYVFDGQAQTLDQLFVTPVLGGTLGEVRVAHINSDWPGGGERGATRGLSDHDPQVAQFTLVPSLEGLEALLQHLADADEIQGKSTVKILQDRLARVRTFSEEGQSQAAMEQLRTFMLQVEGFTPQFISEAAAASLNGEATLLLASM